MKTSKLVNIHNIPPKGQFTQWLNKENLQNSLPKRLEEYAQKYDLKVLVTEVEYSGPYGYGIFETYRADGYVVFGKKIMEISKKD